jgi:hypothetical protein
MLNITFGFFGLVEVLVVGFLGFLSDAFDFSLSTDSRIIKFFFAVWSLHKEISCAHFKCWAKSPSNFLGS